MPKQHASTMEWEALKKSITGKHAKKFDAIMSDLDNEDFCNMYLKILEYVQPKQQRVETKDTTDPKDQVVRVEYVTSQSDIEGTNK